MIKLWRGAQGVHKRDTGRILCVSGGWQGEVMSKWRSKRETETIQEKRVCRSIPGWRNSMCKGLETSKGRSPLDHRVNVK